MIKECPNCKFPGNIPGANFCSNCGTPLINRDNFFSFMEFVEYTRLMRGNKLDCVQENDCVIIPCSWHTVGDFHEGLAWVEEDGKKGFIDVIGNMVIPCKWQTAEDFSEGLARVTDDRNEYFIDRNGNVVLESPEDYSFDFGGFHEGLAIIESFGKYGFIDKRGNVVIPCKWNSASSFIDGVSSISNENGKYGCIDRSGRIVVPCIYDEEIVFSEGLGMTYLGDEICYIDRNGRKAIEIFCTGASIFAEGSASIEDQGFIDKNGDFVINDRWCCDWDNGFFEGLAATEEWGYIDHSGRTVIRNEWEICHPFKDGLAMVELHGKIGYIDHSGFQIIPCVWDSGKYFHEGLANVTLSGKTYCINKRGKILCNVRKS